MVAGALKLALAVNPLGQRDEIFGRQLFDGLLNFLNFAHAVKLPSPEPSRKRELQIHNRRYANKV